MGISERSVYDRVEFQIGQRVITSDNEKGIIDHLAQPWIVADFWVKLDGYEQPYPYLAKDLRPEEVPNDQPEVGVLPGSTQCSDGNGVLSPSPESSGDAVPSPSNGIDSSSGTVRPVPDGKSEGEGVGTGPSGVLPDLG